MFTGFAESLQNRFITALEFSPDSINRLQERVINGLEDIENHLGVKFAIAGRDFPIHSTLMEGLLENTQEEQRSDIFNKLGTEIELDVNGIEVTFDFVLIDGGNIILVAKDIPDILLKIREKLSSHYTNAGAKPLAMENILHVSLARIVDLPIDFNHELYLNSIISLRHDVSSDPLVLAAENVAKEQTYSYLTASKTE